MRINLDGSIYDENNNHYGEHILFSHIDINGDNKTLVCKLNSEESFDRVNKILGNKPKHEIKDDCIYIYLNEKNYDIHKLNKFITFFDGVIGNKALEEIIL